MAANILRAIHNIINQTERTIQGHENDVIVNRANSMGTALERYIKDAFAGTFHVTNEEDRNTIYSDKFSWLGNQNNPPDFIIKQGDAVEVKKIESSTADLALNSSYPKARLYSNSPMITIACRDCESEAWNEKDIIYAIGHVNNHDLKSLWLVYGDIYAANHLVYERIKSIISSGINEIHDVEFAETKELGRVNSVDPLGITNLRIRGMWTIQNPRNVYRYLHTPDSNSTFELVCIIPIEKYNNFDEESRAVTENISVEGYIVENSNVMSPDNPAHLIPVKVIKYVI